MIPGLHPQSPSDESNPSDGSESPGCCQIAARERRGGALQCKNGVTRECRFLKPGTELTKRDAVS